MSVELLISVSIELDPLAQALAEGYSNHPVCLYALPLISEATKFYCLDELSIYIAESERSELQRVFKNILLRR